ncbi:MAG: glycosyltransferase family 2 protein [Nitriliruptoraceae bacterium]
MQAPDPREVRDAATASAADEVAGRDAAVTEPEPDEPRWGDDAPSVLAVVVAHDGSLWLNAALDALESQDYPNVDILAVDNASTDGSREVLIDRLGPDRVIISDKDMGFGAAVSMALDAGPAEIPYVWMLHDDVAFLPDALSELVAVIDRDESTAIVGPKLRDWSDGDLLQSVGWTIDVTGRADSGVDPGELDQGQRDQRQPTLYVSTAGMLARRSVLDEVGRFDRRFHLFRDDLDLCWRVWQADHQVQVVPEAIGAHVNAAADYVRLGQTAHLGPRYFAERNTLATLLKNYGVVRLLLVVPLFFLVGSAKVAGFVLTRRFGDAWQTLRAWVWNLLHLRGTLRLRRMVQAARVRSDSDLKVLFGRVTTRIRAYSEALGYWITGGDHAPAPADEPRHVEVERDQRGRLAELVRSRPVMLAGIVLVTSVMIGTWQLLVPGEIRGGQLAAWPSSPMTFFQDYLASWNEGAAFGTSATPSPAQALLGMLHLVVGGSDYLAPRVLLFGTVGVAWVFALRAAQQYSPRRVPRVVAATAYVLSPPSLAALATGQVDALVLMAVLPGVVAAAVTFSDRRSSPAQAWRAVSAATLLTAVGGSFEPWFLVVAVLAGAALLLGTFASGVPGVWQRTLTARVLAAMIAPVVLLLPWSLDLLQPTGPLFTGVGMHASASMWQWLALSPDVAGFPGLIAGAGFVLAGLLGLAIGLHRVPGLVIGLWSVALAGAAAGWWLGRTGQVMWPGLPLLLTAAAFAALFALAFASAESQLGRFGFGWRQIAALVTASAVVVSVVAVAAEHVRSGLDAYALDDLSLPAFIAASADTDDFRVLVLADQPEGVAWEVVKGTGPSMTAIGVPPMPALGVVDDIVNDVTSQKDPWATALLGLLNVRYVVVPDGGTSDALDAALRNQISLEPRPVSVGRVYTVSGWVPPGSVVLPAVASKLAAHGRTSGPFDAHPMVREQPGQYVVLSPVRGTVLVAEVDDGEWQATSEGEPLEQLDMSRSGTLAFRPVGAGQQVEVSHTGRDTRGFQVAGQVLAVLLVVSLALRPPRFARQRRSLPAAEPQLARTVDDAARSPGDVPSPGATGSSPEGRQ